MVWPAMPVKRPQHSNEAMIRALKTAPARRAKALERWLAGETVTAIAASMGVSKQRVSQMIKRAKAERAAA